MADFKVIRLSTNTDIGISQVTGSIAKLLCVQDEGQTKQVLKRIEFGNFVEPESAFTPTSIMNNVTIVNGTYIDGPIGRVSGSGFLVYLNN
tara:strand:+ start:84 stop:356 length:273 start_codon:yes stop_codon:yes gene_type:complete